MLCRWSDWCTNSTRRYNTFASAGSDGTVSVWDHKVKKRLRQYPKFPTGMFFVLLFTHFLTPLLTFAQYITAVSAVAFNCDGTKLGIASSYTWDEGEAGLRTQPAGVPWVGVRQCGDEVKPKGWSG